MDIERDFGVAECQDEQAGSVTSRGVNPIMKDILERKVKLYLEEKKIYLDPKMSLQKFSSLTSTNTTYLSNTVNDCFGCNFRVLLNRYRIEQAKHMMVGERGLVKDLYKRCGFTSRSVFYASFKSMTGKTPSEYLKEKISDNDSYWK